MSRRRKQQKLLGVFLVLSLFLVNSTNADLVGYWNFDEGTGNIALDKSGSGNDGTLVNGPTWIPGKIGSGALSFDGLDDMVEIAENPVLDLDESMTIMAWINLNDLATYYILMAKGPSGTAGGNYAGNYALRIERNTGNLQMMHQTSEGGTYTRYTSNTSVTVGQWHNIALTLVKGGQVTFYVNGWAAGSAPQTGDIIVNDEPVRIGTRKDNYSFWNGAIDDVQIYNHALTAEEIQTAMMGVAFETADVVSPQDGAIDVLREVVLRWQPGAHADQHDVYFGTDFDDVRVATPTVDPGGVYKGRQNQSTYAPSRLDLDQTYYWRVDEVNDTHPDSPWNGDVWEFRVESFGYPIENITVAASSANRDDEGPENTINGSGVDDRDLHSSENTAMWLSNILDADKGWIQYEFDGVHKLYRMLIWNYNSSVEPIVGFGIKESTIEYSIDGADWSVLGTTHEFARGPGATGYAPNTTVDLGGVSAKYVKITANSNWGGMVNQFGLSEVRFLSIPVLAKEPKPASGATDVNADVTLSWISGREAAKHDVYLSTDEQALIDAAAPLVTVTEPGYATSLDLASTYYWRIDEVNDAETPTNWQGDIWSLSTQEYLVVEDFESYNDIPSEEEGSNLVYSTWVDGFGSATNGSTMGYTEAFQPSMEKTLAHDGRQSSPLFYDNSTTDYSEVTANVADLDVGQDWTEHGVKALTLRFYGDPANVVQQMYVKINGTKVIYDGSAENLKLKAWQMWYIDLASAGVNLSNVTELAIGFERIGALGGQGLVLIDGIRLYSYDRQLATPVDPGTTGLQVHYEFEGNTNDSSGNARHGTAAGNPVFGAGKIGQAIGLDGLGDYVNIDGYKGVLGSSAVTVTAWIKTTSTESGAIVGWGPNVAGQRFGFRVDAGRLRLEHQGGNIQGDTSVNDGYWHHVAVTVHESATISYPDVILYVNGADDTRPTRDADPFNLTAAEDVSIGSRPASGDRLFIGQIDDVRIYDRALTPEEITWLTGRTEPFDKPL